MTLTDHDPRDTACPVNDRDGYHQLACTCVLRGNRPIQAFNPPENSLELSEPALREAYAALLAHHIAETSELARRTRRPRAFVEQRVRAMRARPRMWATSQESFVLQIVAMLDVVGIDFASVRDKFVASMDPDADKPVSDAYATLLVDQALELLR